MVAALRWPRKIKEEEYLQLERQAEFKSEYIDGYLYDMAGGTQPHSLISAGAINALMNSLRGSNCRVHTSDMRIHVPNQRFYSYPDASVVCGEPKFKDNKSDTLTNPILIVEVLSPSTEEYDQTEKFERYSQLKSLQYYILVSQYDVWAEVRTRRDEDNWDEQQFTSMADVISLDRIGCTVSLADIYNQVDFKGSAME